MDPWLKVTAVSLILLVTSIMMAAIMMAAIGSIGYILFL